MLERGGLSFGEMEEAGGNGGVPSRKSMVRVVGWKGAGVALVDDEDVWFAMTVLLCGLLRV